MKKIKSNLQYAEELANLINQKTKYKCKVDRLNALIFASGHTLTIKKTFWKRIQIVYYHGEISYYNDGNISESTIQIIKDIENLTKKNICLRDVRTISLGGR